MEPDIVISGGPFATMTFVMADALVNIDGGFTWPEDFDIPLAERMLVERAAAEALLKWARSSVTVRVNLETKKAVVIRVE